MGIMHAIYPWQKQQWRHFLSLMGQNRLPHALLLNGVKDLGKRTFAMALAERLFCAHPGEIACGVCQECQLFASGAHPDFHLVETLEQSKVIKIEQIRALVGTLGQTPQRAGFQVVVMEPLEALNTASANAFLKTLEEPQGTVIFILVSHQRYRVSPTIRSRCQRVDFFLPDAIEALDWLKHQGLSNPDILLRLAEGLPLRAHALAQGDHLVQHEKILSHFLDVRLGRLSPVEAAANLSAIAPEQLFQVFASAVIDIIHLQLHGIVARVVNVAQQEKLQTMCRHLSARRLFDFLDTLLLFKQKNDASVSLNQQLLLEGVLIEWMNR